MIELTDVLAIIRNPVLFIKPIMMNPWLVYPVLWAIVGFESCFVLFAWLPAETTMFLAGSLAAHQEIPIQLWWLWLGYLPVVYLGWRFKFRRGLAHNTRNRRMDDTVDFFNQHAKLAMLFGRYIPVLGIFIPLIAGESRYDQATFQRQNIIGALIWVLGSTLIGYYLGSIPFFQQHFSVLIAGIIVVPAGIYYAVTYLNSLFHHLRR